MTGSAVILDRDRARARAEDLCAFIDASPMPHQAAAECGRRLRNAGYQQLSEADAWTLEPGAGYYVVRGGTSVVAFRLGRDAPSATGVAAVGAHLDSPNLRVKPLADCGLEGYRQLGVEVYGGAIVASWTDRDLGLAGRVVVRGEGGGPRGGSDERLVTIRRPVARVANLAIHLNRKVNTDGLLLDKQRHLPPLVGLSGGDADDWSFQALLAREAGVDATDVIGWDVGLFDVTPSAFGGVDEEFLFAPRLDNLASSHAGLVAMIEGMRRQDAPPDCTWLLALYDHEECGSRSMQGAAGPLLLDIVRRLAVGHPAADGDASTELARTLARSLLISADMAHAVHPNHAEMHEPGHRPRLNLGPVLKRAENQSYATDGESAAAFTRLCQAAGFPPQHFVNRSDLRGGSTIGPIAAAGTGLTTVDVGNPMLSMHSVREMGGAWDQDLMIEALAQHFA